MNDRLREEQGERDGLCATCRHRRDVFSDRGSRFVFCDRSRTDLRFPRYPPLPVRACIGYEPVPA